MTPVGKAADPKGRKLEVLTEKTAKKFKEWWLIGAMLFVLGMVVASKETDPQKQAAAGAIGSVGLLIAVVTKIRAWWHHG